LSGTDNDSLPQQLFITGTNHLFGRHTTIKDPSLAIDYFQQAAALGHSASNGVLGFCYEFGLGVTEMDFGLAEYYYLEAAQHHDGLGMARLAFLRKYGRPNVKIDRAESEEWAERVRRHFPPSSSETSAIRWIEDAAVNDHDPACQYALGVCYHDGIGVEKDEHLAFHW
jgi:TPR repeat protein